jgi:hypothetical protein
MWQERAGGGAALPKARRQPRNREGADREQGEWKGMDRMRPGAARALLTGLILLASFGPAAARPAAAQGANPTANTASAPTPVEEPLRRPAEKSGGPNAGPAPAENPAPAEDLLSTCDRPIPTAIQGGNSKVVVELDPTTIWRPRGSEVRLVFSGSGIAVQNVQACFGWSTDPGSASAGGGAVGYLVSPLVRSITNNEGKIEYGATVPDLAGTQVFWINRILGNTPIQFTGLFVVPVARMQVLATILMPDRSIVRVPVALPVGVTSVWYGIALTALAVFLSALGLYFVIANRALPGNNPILKVIATRDGFASLSQFQIILWTFVVGAAAIYVMALSGNLIGITSGTLVLLGIAGVTTILARVPPIGAKSGGGPAGSGGSGPPAASRAPKWSDLVIVDRALQEIDVTRVQMLIFTMISASFVALKVLTSYEIPEIPEGYLALMGISNGVYLTGKHVNP